MLRFAIALLVTIVVSETAEAAEKPPAPHRSQHGWHRTVVLLPAGLPRRHYDFRTTISYGEPAFHQTYRPRMVYLDEAPEPLFAPVYVDGGAYVPYWDRLPYACGVYGYC